MGKHSFTHLQVNGGCVELFSSITNKRVKRPTLLVVSISSLFSLGFAFFFCSHKRWKTRVAREQKGDADFEGRLLSPYHLNNFLKKKSKMFRSCVWKRFVPLIRVWKSFWWLASFSRCWTLNSRPKAEQYMNEQTWSCLSAEVFFCVCVAKKKKWVGKKKNGGTHKHKQGFETLPYKKYSTLQNLHHRRGFESKLQTWAIWAKRRVSGHFFFLLPTGLFFAFSLVSFKQENQRLEIMWVKIKHQAKRRGNNGKPSTTWSVLVLARFPAPAFDLFQILSEVRAAEPSMCVDWFPTRNG